MRRYYSSDDPEQRWLMKALREVANELVEEMYDLYSASPDWCSEDDDRTLHEIAAHLRAYEDLTLAQIRHLTSGRDTPLPVEDTEPLSEGIANLSIYTLLEDFVEARRRTSHTLWGITERQWQRQGKHPYRGTISLRQIVKELSEHDLEYLWRIRRARSELPDDVP